LIFPDYCLACEQALVKGEDQLCTECRYHLPQSNFHLDPRNILTKRFAGAIPLRYCLAYLKFEKGSKVQRILHTLKYEGNQSIGISLGKWYGQHLVNHSIHEHFDLILPVPLHPSKLKKRGYNQSDTFAQGLSEAMNVPWSADILARTKATETQTRKSKSERWENVSSIFEVKESEMVKSKRILLVDDVITTGATIEACLQVLQKADSQELSIGSIAVALH
jgi:ComF family protein